MPPMNAEYPKICLFKPKKPVVLRARVDTDLKEFFVGLASKTDMDLSDHVRHALREYAQKMNHHGKAA